MSTHFRFHDSVLLDGSLYAGGGTMLELKNVQPSDSGEYKCRANNDVRGIYSNAASLSVKGTVIITAVWWP